MITPEELVRRVSPGLPMTALRPEELAAIDHALRNHVQTVYCLEAALEDKVREIITAPATEAGQAANRGRER